MLTTLFQAVLAVVAFLISWFLRINPLERFELSGRALITGIAGAIPMLPLLAVTLRSRFGRIAQIRQFLIETLGPFLSECRWHDLAWMALITGLAEELMFRAVLQTWLEPRGLMTCLLVTNLLFALGHPITPLYSLLAGLLGIYLGLFFHYFGEGNLLAPAVAHGFYDFVGFVLIRRVYCTQEQTRSQPAGENHPPEAAVAESGNT